MKNLSKILSIILCIAMCIGMNVNAMETSYEEASIVFSKLGIMETELDADPNAMCTRGEFAVAVANALKLPDVEETRFFDVPRDYDGFGKINALCDMGIIRGDGQGNFHPERVITAGEAAVMMMGATEHTLHMDADKMNMSLKFARDLEVFAPDMPLAGEISMVQATEMIYRMMYVRSLIYSGTDKEGGMNYSEGSKTLFEMHHDVKAFYGKVDGIYGTSLNGNIELKENEISIDGEKYALDYNADGYGILGKEVKVVYTSDKYGKNRKVIYLGDYNSDTKEIKIFDDYYVGFNPSTYQISYIDDKDREKSAKIERNSYIIYNGSTVGSNVNAFMAGLDGSKDNLEITLRDADSNGIYEIVIIDKYVNYIVNSIDTTNNIVHAEKLDGSIVSISVDENDIDYATITDQSGKKIDIDSLAVDSLISVFLSDTNVRIVSSLTSVSGMLDSVSNEKAMLIDSKKYAVANELWISIVNTTVYGQVYNAKIDAFGKIARLELGTGSSMTWGYLIDGTYENSLNESITLRILSQDGSFGDYTLRKNVKIDGISMKGETIPRIYANIGEHYPSGQVKPQLIRFKANSDNEISSIDTSISTSYESAENAMAKTEEQGDIYFSSFKRFGFKTLINNSTIIFRVPDIDDNGDLVNATGVSTSEIAPKESDYAVVSNTFTNGGHYNITGYTDDTEKAVQDVIVYRANAYNKLGEATPTLGIVTGFSQALNSEGDAVPSFTIMTGGGEKKYFALNSRVTANIGEGDLVEVSSDLKDNAAEIKIYYDYSADKLIGWASGHQYINATNYYGQPQLTYGNALAIKKGVLQIGYEQTERVDEAIDVSTLTALVHDKRYEGDKSVYQGTMGDITTFEQVGDNCSKIFILTNGTVFRGVFIYK